MKNIDVRPAKASDRADWLRLWQGYCEFYEVAIPEEVTTATWHRLNSEGSGMHCFVATQDGAVLGFANAVVHPHTWGTSDCCYLEDLFVDMDARGLGIGRALIDALVTWAKARGCGEVYWHTNATNSTARRLYDTYAAADGVVRYTLKLADNKAARDANAG